MNRGLVIFGVMALALTPETTFGQVSERCPPRNTGAGAQYLVECYVTTSLPADLRQVNFEKGSFVLSPAAIDIADRLARFLKSNPKLGVIVSGNCDIREAPTEKERAECGMARSKALADYLIGQGIEPARIPIRGNPNLRVLAEVYDEKTLEKMRYVSIWLDDTKR